MEMDGEDPLLDAYITKTLKQQPNTEGKNATPVRRPSFQGSKRRYNMSDEAAEMSALTKEISGLKEEVRGTVILFIYSLALFST